ncbi:MAG: hypothetical protein AAB370_07910 [Verrucomicrobiota bacterium]
MSKNKKNQSNRPPEKYPEIAEEKIPIGLEFIAGKGPMEAMQAAIPNAEINFAALAPFIALQGFDFGFQVPEWAKEAARNALGILKIEPLDMNGAFASAAVGQMVGFVESAPPPKDKRLASDKLKRVQEHFCQTAKTEAANANAAVSKKFFDARAKGPNVIQRLGSIPQRGKAFFFIAITWQKIATFESGGELHRWLIKNKAIRPGTDAAETRAMCRLIGYPLKKTPGRPTEIEK